ncbi:MAG: thioredoxin [Anaerolineales bacterium]
MSKAKAVDETTFESEVLNASKPVLVDFWASWCPPCRALAPTLDELAEEVGDKMRIVKVNVQEVTEVPQRFSVMNIPTLILFKNGEETLRLVGNRSKKALLKELQPYI